MGLEAPDRGTMTIRLSPDGPLRTAAVFQEDRLLEGYTALQTSVSQPETAIRQKS